MLCLEKPSPQQKIDSLLELKKVCAKISLFQAMKYVPIYAKVLRDLCLKKLVRKKKDPKTI